MNARGELGKEGEGHAAAAQYVTCCIWLSLTSGHISVIHFAVLTIEYKSPSVTFERFLYDNVMLKTLLLLNGKLNASVNSEQK